MTRVKDINLDSTRDRDTVDPLVKSSLVLLLWCINLRD